MRMPETEGKAFRQLRKADPTAAERALLRAAADAAEEPLPLDVLARSLTTVESDARRLRRKNQLALEAAIAESQKEAAQTDRAARLAAEQTRAVLAARSNSGGSSNADPYAAFELLRRHRLPGDAKGKGPASKQ